MHYAAESNSPSDGRPFQRALRLLSSEGLDGAALLIERELENNSKNWEAWAAKADLLYLQDKFEAALKCCHLSLQINPQNAFAWNLKGNALYRLGKYGEAIECYDKAIDADPLFMRAWYNKKLAVKIQLEKATKKISLQRKLPEKDFGPGDGSLRATANRRR